MTLIAGTCGDGATRWKAALLLPEDGPRCDMGQLGPGAFVARGPAGALRLWHEAELMCVADARLDDRAALCRALRVDDPALPDVALIAHAWRRWGENAADALIGDYAFAVFDARQERLWLVRDALGFRPLCFAAEDRAAAFCSLPSRLNGERVCRTAGASHRAPDSWYRNVAQVQPGERIALRPGAATRTAWWQPSTSPRFTGMRQDLLAAAGSALREAVTDRVTGDDTIACHLSAGLDSMAVAVTAADVLGGGEVVAVTAAPARGQRWIGPRGRLLDEAPYAAQVAALYPAMCHLVATAAGRSIMADLADTAALFGEPLTNPVNYGWFAATGEAARTAGASILLVGQMGNFGLSAAAADPWWSMLHREGAGRCLDEWWHGPWRAPGGELLRRMRRRPQPGAAERLAVIRGIDPGLFLKGLERQGLSVLDPTADRRLIELMLSVPDHLLLWRGDPRWLTRALLRGRVPDAVLDERRRGYQAADWLSRVQAEAAPLAALLERAGEQFAASAAIMRTLPTRFDDAADADARALAPNLATAAFLLGADA